MEDRSPPHSAHAKDVLAQSLCDVMVTSQPSFNLVDAEDQCSLHAMMSSSQVPDTESLFSPSNDTRSSFEHASSSPKDTQRFPQKSEVGEPPLGSAHVWHERNTDPNDFAAKFPNANFIQQMVQTRRIVKRQLYLTTPPDETERKLEPSDSGVLSEQIAGTPSAERAGSERSERARYAANQRHAKTKKTRKDSWTIEPAIGDEAEDKAGDNKAIYRVKNRLAAARCRAKNKENTKDIDMKHRKLSAVNSSLKKQVQDLRGELMDLRTHALNHQECGCQISRYNINQAKRMIVEAEGSSPSMGFQNSRDPVRCFQSPPVVRGMNPGTNSFGASSFTFAPVTTPEDMGDAQMQDELAHLGEYVWVGG